jgi:hypothetical protein
VVIIQSYQNLILKQFQVVYYKNSTISLVVFLIGQSLIDVCWM